jgi:hypothetical protein
MVSIRVDLERTCICGQCKAICEDDDISVTYSGPALLLGFKNSEMTQAMRDQIQHGDAGLKPMGFPYAHELQGRQFTGFVLPFGTSCLDKEDEQPTWDQLADQRAQYTATQS